MSIEKIFIDQLVAQATQGWTAQKSSYPGVSHFPPTGGSYNMSDSERFEKRHIKAFRGSNEETGQNGVDKKVENGVTSPNMSDSSDLDTQRPSDIEAHLKKKEDAAKQPETWLDENGIVRGTPEYYKELARRESRNTSSSNLAHNREPLTDALRANENQLNVLPPAGPSNSVSSGALPSPMGTTVGGATITHPFEIPTQSPYPKTVEPITQPSEKAEEKEQKVVKKKGFWRTPFGKLVQGGIALFTLGGAATGATAIAREADSQGAIDAPEGSIFDSDTPPAQAKNVYLTSLEEDRAKKVSDSIKTEDVEPETPSTQTPEPTITVVPSQANPTQIATAFPTRTPEVVATATTERITFPDSVEGTPVTEIKTQNGRFGISNNNSTFGELVGTGNGILNTPEAIQFLADKMATFLASPQLAKFWNQINPAEMNGNIFVELNPTPSAEQLSFNGVSIKDMIQDTGLVVTTERTESGDPYEYFGMRVSDNGDLILTRNGNGYPERKYKSLMDSYGLTREQAASLMIISDILDMLTLAERVVQANGEPPADSDTIKANVNDFNEFLNEENAKTLIDIIFKQAPVLPAN